MVEYLKPIPVPTSDSEPFWNGCRSHVLRLQRCRGCGRARFYPRAACPHCWSRESDWVEASGRGHVYSFSVQNRGPSPAFKPDCPYVFAVVELLEGPRLPTNVVGCGPDRVRIGMAVEVTYEDVAEGVTLPKFRPIEAGQA